MLYRISLFALLGFFVAAPILASVPGRPSPKCKCPILPHQNFTRKACGLQWISKVRILTWKVENVKGSLINRYTVKHLDVFKGAKNLPTTLLVPVNCEMVLGIGSNYLLGGFKAGNSQLYTTRCLSLYGPSPVWTVVPSRQKNKLQHLKCPKGSVKVPALPSGIPTVPLSD